MARCKLLQLLEFVTGIDNDEVVGDNRRTRSHAMAMSDRNEARGRRGRDLLKVIWLHRGWSTACTP